MLRRILNLTKALIIHEGKSYQVCLGNEKVGGPECFV